MDLFVSRLSNQLPQFFSWRVDPLVEAIDAFSQQWGPLKGYANPPWCLVGRVLSQVRSQQAQVILVAPVWKGQSWYTVLLGMLFDYPRQLPRNRGTFQIPPHSVQMEFLPQLAVWPISGTSLEVQTFLIKLRNSSSHPGGVKHRDTMIPTSRNGWAGVLNEVVIPFQDPLLM